MQDEGVARNCLSFFPLFFLFFSSRTCSHIAFAEDDAALSLSVEDEANLVPETQPEETLGTRKSQRKNAGTGMSALMTHLGLGNSDDEGQYDDADGEENFAVDGDKELVRKRSGKGKGVKHQSLSQPAPKTLYDVDGEGDNVMSQPVAGKTKRRRRPVATSKETEERRTQRQVDKDEKARVAAEVARRLLPEFAQRRGHGWCVCFFLNPLTLDVLHALIEVTGLSLQMQKGKRLTKLEILAQMCSHDGHDSADAVKRVLDGPASKEMIKFYYPEVLPENLSVVHAFHLFIVRHEGLFLIPGARDRLHDFRAHFMQHLVTNYNYYVVRGKQNRVGTVGTEVCPIVVGRFANFFRACLSMLDHYGDVHSNHTCGLLRKGQVCAPSFTWVSSPDGQRLRVLFREGIIRVSRAFVGIMLLNHVEYESLEFSFPNQPLLQELFVQGPTQEIP